MGGTSEKLMVLERRCLDLSEAVEQLSEMQELLPTRMESKKCLQQDVPKTLHEKIFQELKELEETMTMTMTMTHSEKSHIRRMKAWPYKQECRGHDTTKKNLLC